MKTQASLKRVSTDTAEPVVSGLRNGSTRLIGHSRDSEATSRISADGKTITVRGFAGRLVVRIDVAREATRQANRIANRSKRHTTKSTATVY